MVDSLYLENNEKINDLYEKAVENNEFKDKSEKIRKELINITLNEAEKISRKKPRLKNYHRINRKLDNYQNKIESLKEKYFIDPFSYSPIHIDLIEKNNKSNALYNLINKNRWDLKSDIITTLDRVGNDSSFIREASEGSGIPLEDILSLIHIESSGKEFALSLNGCINRMQINPRYAKLIYDEVTYQNNNLAYFIKKNSSKDDFVENLVKNSKLNIAVGVNYFKHLREYFDDEAKALVAYNFGIPNLKDMEDNIINKLYKRKFSRDDLKFPTISYYAKYKNAKNTLKEIKNYLS